MDRFEDVTLSDTPLLHGQHHHALIDRARRLVHVGPMAGIEPSQREFDQIAEEAARVQEKLPEGKRTPLNILIENEFVWQFTVALLRFRKVVETCLASMRLMRIRTNVAHRDEYHEARPLLGVPWKISMPKKVFPPNAMIGMNPQATSNGLLRVTLSGTASLSDGSNVDYPPCPTLSEAIGFSHVAHNKATGEFNIAGETGCDQTGHLVGQSVTEQTRQALRNILTATGVVGGTSRSLTVLNFMFPKPEDIQLARCMLPYWWADVTQDGSKPPFAEYSRVSALYDESNEGACVEAEAEGRAPLPQAK